MTAPSPNETWIVEMGDAVIEKRARTGNSGLSAWERLVYCLWATDYMMRNAGDLANAVDLYPQFQSDAQDLSRKLRLLTTYEAFCLSPAELERQYFQRFEAICNEIKAAGKVRT
jgi:hypothetical protein